MKIYNSLTKLFLSLFVATAFFGCEDFEVENLNAPDRERALAETTDVISLIDGAVTDSFYASINLWAVHIDGLADQISTTNAYLDFWGFMDQPRRPINNNTTNSDMYPFEYPWDSYNSFIYNANTVLSIIDDGTTLIDADGFDVTKQKEMASYWVRGFSLGYIGMLYDKGYRVDQTTDLSALAFEDSNNLIDYALADIDKALQIAAENPSIGMRVHSGSTIENAEFVGMANSFAAKILAGKARTASDSVDWAKVLTYANNGITEDFDPKALNGVIYNNYQDWSTYTLSTGAGYLPVDQKVVYLIEKDETKQPMDYPTDSSITLSPISNTTDARIDDYFAYSTSFGYLRESRGRHLFTNYRHKRFYTGNNRNVTGYSLNIFPVAEVHYLKAEANLKLGDLAAAAAALDASPHGTYVGSVAADATSIAKALLYEYSVEMHLNGTGGTNFFFMRRHDLLQNGSPIEYPIPASELEITGDSFYTFGGDGANNPSTASGTGWKGLGY